MLIAHIPELQYLKVISNLAGVLPVARCVKRKLYIEGIVITFTYVVSFMYHLSSITMWKILIPLQKWHFLDRSFICITATVLALYLIDIKNSKYKRILQVLSSLLILILGFNYFLKVWAITLLWLILVMTVIGNFIYKKIHPNNWNEVILGIEFLFIAVVSALAPYILGSNTYWFFRSIWHVASAVSIYFLLGANNRQLITQ